MIVVNHNGNKYAFIEKRGVWVNSTNSIVDDSQLVESLRDMAIQLGHSLPDNIETSPHTNSESTKKSSQEDQVVDKPIRKGKKSTSVSLKNLMKNKQKE